MSEFFGRLSEITLGEFLDRWLNDIARPTIRDSTFLLYTGIINNHIKPLIGGYPLSTLKSIHIQKFYHQLKINNCAPRPRQLVHVILKMVLRQALKWNHISKNPCDLIAKPPAPKRTMKYWTPEQILHFLESAKSDRLYALYVLALSTGLRQGELFGLQWIDFNEQDSSLSIQRTTYELNGYIYEGEPKTAKGRRKIDLPKFAIAALKKHQKAMLKEGIQSKWIFSDTLGNPLRRGQF